MANKRSKKKLTSKQVKRISLVITAIYFICIFTYGMIPKPNEDVFLKVEFLTMCCVGGTFLVYHFFYSFIFKGKERANEERVKVIESITTQCLSRTYFRQVYFLAKGHGIYIDMIRQILEKEGCKFYAKLTKNNNIYLIVKDKYNEKVYSVEIENHVYFYSNFKFVLKLKLKNKVIMP